MTTDVYDPIPFWERRGASCPTGDTSLEPLALSMGKIVTEHQRDGDTFLDVGAGWGRVYLWLQKNGIVDAGEYSMCDIAQSSIDKCSEMTGIVPRWWDSITLPYDDESFDWVISFSVLLHVPPADIAQHVAELVRVTRRYLFVSTYNGRGLPLQPWCFEHDYDDVFETAGLTPLGYGWNMNLIQGQWLLGK
jgi:2-polyprenyl-3-methyl-5-hydroxy-6-metoxy-1,4-benzoquinol methylase